MHDHAATHELARAAAGDTADVHVSLFLELSCHFRRNLSGITALADNIAIGAGNTAHEDGAGGIAALMGDAALVGAVAKRSLVDVGDETEVVLSTLAGCLDGAGFVDGEVRHFPALLDEFEEACSCVLPVFDAEAATVETA